MAHLTKPPKYDVKDSNIALLGSDLEERVREHAGDTEPAWKSAGAKPGVEVWRIEQFQIIPREVNGEFYDGDSYIVLHTYKKNLDSETLSYDLHFWLGEETSQDEAGTAAYKTVELDDHLYGVPVQYREVQGYESSRFLSYFRHFVCLHGGIESGFRHIVDPPSLDVRILYHISFTTKNNLVIRQVPARSSSLIQGDVYVLDMGTKVWQFNTKDSAGKEKFRAAEFVRNIVDKRDGQPELTVYDEGGSGAGIFLNEFGEGTTLRQPGPSSGGPRALFRLSDASGSVTFEGVEPPTSASLSSSDAFLLDDSYGFHHPAVYVWIGKSASLTERKLAPQYAQRYLHQRRSSAAHVSIVKMGEEEESDMFLQAVRA
ncbi:actin depolymerizing protein [Guyanagaster necrorhizus]|uniref:Actin depolymerizing protein n=1 Tax=Guyanagaster necrorhizus TaxID=856835 RepID=A0A9P7VQX7_9AGAR|nr:actin depolymerizing protein [Guyanagaster necrorhizus MCA 3950]KAG7445801.1 actin depolymerizing protein [Guyanagaster necrorhizus MCA 3950]